MTLRAIALTLWGQISWWVRKNIKIYKAIRLAINEPNRMLEAFGGELGLPKDPLEKKRSDLTLVNSNPRVEGAHKASIDSDYSLTAEQPIKHSGAGFSLAPTPNFNEFMAFLDSFLNAQNSAHTRRAYEKDLEDFLSYLQKTGQTITVHTLVEYRKQLESELSPRTGQPISHVSINRKMATIKSFLNWLVLNSVLPNNPARAIKSFRAGRESPTRDIPDDRVAAMLSLPARHRVAGRMHYAILMTLFHLGLRRSELVGLRTSDLFEQEGMSVIRVRGKGDKERILPIPAELMKALQTYLEMARKDIKVDQPLFSPVKNNITKEKNKPLHPNAIAYIVKHYARLAGVSYRVSPHSARATAVSNALDNQAPHRSVQHMAGWSSPLMVSRYDKRKQDLKNSAVRFICYSSSD